MDTKPLEEVASYLDWSESWYFGKNKYIEKPLWYVNRVYDDKTEKGAEFIQVIMNFSKRGSKIQNKIASLLKKN